MKFVHIVDDDAFVRNLLSAQLSAAGFETTEHASGTEFLAQAPELPAGCVLLDVEMPGINGPEVQAELGRRGLPWPVIIVSAAADVPIAVTAMKEGAADVLLKPVAGQKLLDAVNAALAQMESAAEAEGKAQQAKALVEALAPREREVLQGLLAGLASKVIAYKLGLSTRTVEVYRRNLGAKLGAASLSAQVQIALEAGLTPLAE